MDGPRRARVAVRVAARSKFGARRTVVDGVTFDSRREARRGAELALLAGAHQIRNLQRQVPYALHALAPDGELVPIGAWRADFVYEAPGGAPGKPWVVVVEDVKGVRTPLYRWKKKHVEAEYHLRIVEV